MAHTHDVYDMENHFEINGSSRFIKETSETKLVVVQGDHKSEVLTFKMPRYIDGHDMTLCNKIRIHYINLDTKTNNKSADVYEVTDLTLCEECEDVLTFTWTIEAPATKYSGTLSFLVKFECTEGENVLYQWNTAMYVSVNVLAGIDNSEEFVEKYSNVLEEWYNELTKGADSIEELNQQAIAEIELAKEDAKEDIQGKADATMYEMNQFSFNAYNSFKNDVDVKAKQTLESIPEEYSSVDADIKSLNEMNYTDSGIEVPLLRTRDNKSLVGNGEMVSDGNSNIRIYSVQEGEWLWLKLSQDNDGVFQFSKNDYSATTYMIGNPVNTEFEGIVKVPNGATYLMVSCFKTNTANIVHYASSKIEENAINIKENKEAISGMVDILYKSGDLLEIATTRVGYAIGENGNPLEDANSQQVAYPVKAGEKLFVNLSKDNDVVYQWSKNDIASTTYIVGTNVKEATTGIITVPEGATYLMVSQFISNKTNYVTYVSDVSEEYEATFLRIGTYNIGHFIEGVSQHPMGTEEKKYLFRNAIAELGCNVLAVQENNYYYNEETQELARDAVYSAFKHYSSMMPNIYTCNGIASDFKLYNIREKYFNTQVSQQRAYYECNIKIDGKIIHIICTHLDWHDATGRREQIDELIARANQFERVIICGDFNPNNPNDAYDSSVFETDFAKWTDAGYKLANGGYFGWLNTIADREGAEEGAYPWDNIIVSPNIQIKAVGRVVKDYMEDHIPIWADLVIY